MCSTDFNLNLKDFLTLPRIVPSRNSVSFSKSIFKAASTTSVRPGKPICDRNISPSKPVSVSSRLKGKPINNRNVRHVKLSVQALLVQVNPFVVVMLV